MTDKLITLPEDEPVENHGAQPTPPKKGRVRGLFWPWLLVTVIASLCCALFFPITMLVVVVTGSILICGIVRFWLDNRNLLGQISSASISIALLKAGLFFIPYLVILLPGLLLAWVVDKALDQGVQLLDLYARPEVLKEPVFGETPWYGYRSWWLGIKQDIVGWQSISKEKGMGIRVGVETLRNLLILMKWYGWFFMMFITLRSFFYLWGRAIVGRGGNIQLTMRGRA